MQPIRNFDELTAHLKALNSRKRIAVVCANDPNTEYAIARALEEGIGHPEEISHLEALSRPCEGHPCGRPRRGGTAGCAHGAPR